MTFRSTLTSNVPFRPEPPSQVAPRETSRPETGRDLRHLDPLARIRPVRGTLGGTVNPVRHRHGDLAQHLRPAPHPHDIPLALLAQGHLGRVPPVAAQPRAP